MLTDRVARLLLAGAQPQKILCLTYTRAAAAEMQNRLFRTLGAWSMLDDEPLRAALADLGETGDIAPEAITRARTLFARALETPGGLKIQTIHSFCDLLLRRFPLEAGVSPRFEVLEERQAKALRGAALDAVAAHEGAIFAAMAEHLSGDEIDGLLQEIAAQRDAFAAPVDRDALAAALDVDPRDTIEALRDRVIDADALRLIDVIAPALLAAGGNDAKAGDRLAAARLAATPEAQLATLEVALLVQTGDNAGRTRDRFPTKATRAAHPDPVAALDAFAARVEASRSVRLGLAALDRSTALHRFARAWLAEYETRKAALGRLDFDDLIGRARGLLESSETAAWVLWRLDGGLDHILIDEAQDTSPAQWRVIEAVSSEFFVGASARDLVRTIFVVGDEKQSIYSFQGADPAAFGRMRGHFDAMLAGLGAELRRCDLLHSFRSAPPILRLVDAVFSGPAADGLEGPVEHRAFHPGRAGRVELWPFVPPPDRPDETPWDAPLDMAAPDDPAQVLAARIAATIRGWLDGGRALPRDDGPRPVRAGDVLILVQRRGPLFHAIIRALKAARVPVAGADVMRLGAELAVRDLIAALRVAATPADDLSLAAFLRGPMGGLSERDLFRLAHGRRGTLWAELLARDAHSEARALVADVLAQADYLRPYELLERMLIRHGGRRRLVSRLGPEAEDGVDALLGQALAYESVEAPTLTGFLEWIDREELVIKRRTDDAADEVRVMTVHGAKGLEAPIVILPDTGDRREGRAPQILRGADGRAFWKPPAAGAPPALAAAEAARRARARAENRRLLYVALTRAEHWLIVCGAGQPPKPDGESWSAAVRAALEGLTPERITDPDGGETLVLFENWTEAPAATPAADAPAAPAILPDWAARPPHRPAALPPPRVASALGGAHALAAESVATAADAEAAKARGVALHALLDALPRAPEADWPRLAARIAGAEAAPLLAEATALMRRPELGFLFAPEALAEVEICAPLDVFGGARLIGRIDRLVVEPGRVRAIDFKSNRDIPARPEDVPEGVLRQMGAYRAALAAVFPGRTVEIAVLWTETARLMPIPHDKAEAALARAAALDPAPAGS